jgi:hypothetical protein
LLVWLIVSVLDEKVTGVLETDGHSVRVSSLGPPPDCQRGLKGCTVDVDLLEVIDLVLVGDTVRNTVADFICVSIDIIGINTFTTLLPCGVDSFSHDGLNVGETFRSLDVEPPFVPFAHLVLCGSTFSGRLVVSLAGTAVTSRIELEPVIPVC